MNEFYTFTKANTVIEIKTWWKKYGHTKANDTALKWLKYSTCCISIKSSQSHQLLASLAAITLLFAIVTGN